jgi:hypothetical protein
LDRDKEMKRAHMHEQIFLQTTIAVVWDFDTTLIPGYMQTPLFKHFNVDEKVFWAEVNSLPDVYRSNGATLVSKDTVYLNHILSYVRAKVFPGLNNAKLKELGGAIQFYDGLPEFFNLVRESVASNTTFRKHEVGVEHYIVSTGLRPMIEGSAIHRFVDGIWASEFVEGSPGPGYLKNPQANLFEGPRVISDIAYALDHTSKTRAIFEINKGTNKIREIEVNSDIALERRRIPFQNMIYVADGPSDIPCFSTINHFGGKTFAVYRPKSEAEFEKAYQLQKQHRVQAFGEADYRPGSQASMWIQRAVRDIAERIVRDRTRALSDDLGQPPGHVIERPAAAQPSTARPTDEAGPPKKLPAAADEGASASRVISER